MYYAMSSVPEQRAVCGLTRVIYFETPSCLAHQFIEGLLQQAFPYGLQCFLLTFVIFFGLVSVVIPYTSWYSIIQGTKKPLSCERGLEVKDFYSLFNQNFFAIDYVDSLREPA